MHVQSFFCSIRHFHISHNAPDLPPKFCITFVFYFPEYYRDLAMILQPTGLDSLNALTSWTCQGWEIWLGRHLGKWRTREWGIRGPPSLKMPMSFGWVSHNLMCSFLCEGWQNETCFLSVRSFMTKSNLSLRIEKQYLHKVSFWKYSFYLHVSTRCCPATSFW